MEQPKVQAKLTNVGISAQKVRLVADLVRGKEVNEAIETLRFLNKEAALPVAKTIMSAASNAEENNNWDIKDLYVANIQINEGVTRKWGKFASRGRYRKIYRRRSHIVVEVSKKDFLKVTKKAEVKPELKTENKIEKNNSKTSKK